MNSIFKFLGGIWEFVMTILLDAGVTTVADWKNPFDALITE